MNCGKLAQDIYERSVVKVAEANSGKNRVVYDGAGIRADCAILAGGSSVSRSDSGKADIGTDTDMLPGQAPPAVPGVLSGQAMADGTDASVAARAYMAAVGQMLVCCANASVPFDRLLPCVGMTLMVPEKMREIKVRRIVEAVTVKAGETGIPVLSCNVQVLPSITEAVAVCIAYGSYAIAYSSNATAYSALSGAGSDMFQCGKKKAAPGEDIVMTKWIALEGTALIASGCQDALCRRYPSDLVGTAADFFRYLTVEQEAACAAKSGADYLLMPREGGIFGGLWQLAADNGVGLVVDLKRIPVRQETIEVCEFFDINPYELLAGGCLLIAVQNGSEMVRALKGQGICAAVIGRTTQGNGRMICHGDETRFLEPARGDEIYRFKNKMKTEDGNERTNIIDHREKQQD